MTRHIEASIKMEEVFSEEEFHGDNKHVLDAAKEAFIDTIRQMANGDNGLSLEDVVEVAFVDGNN